MDREEWIATALESLYNTPDDEPVSAGFVKALLAEIGYGMDDTVEIEDYIPHQHTRPRAPRHKAPLD